MSDKIIKKITVKIEPIIEVEKPEISDDESLREVCEQFVRRVFKNNSASPVELEAATELAKLLASTCHSF